MSSVRTHGVALKFMRRNGDVAATIVLTLIFIYLVFNFNRLEPDIYRIFDIHVGESGSYNIVTLTRQFLTAAVLGSICSTVIGALIGMFCFTAAGREFRPIVEKTAMVMNAFPSIALIFLVIPFLGLGVMPTVTALALHGMLALIFAVIAGIDNIDPNYIRVARGMGMTDGQIMRMIQLPLALPVIVSGLRVSLISCIGGATLARYSGGEGLGVLLKAGQDTYNVVLIMECAVLVCLMSLIADKGLRAVERRLSFHGDDRDR